MFPGMPLFVIGAGLLVWSIWSPWPASTAFIVVFTLVEGYVLLGQRTARFNPDPQHWDLEEVAVLREYPLYFRFPMSSRSLSGVLSAVQLSVFLWVPWLLYNELWWQAILIGMNYFLAGRLAVKLNPRGFLHDAVERKGKTDMTPLMEAVDRVCEKILDMQRGRSG